MKHLSSAAVALSWALSASAATSTAVQVQNWNAAGLNAPADIVIDHWGIAHIFAANMHDAFFLQGYNAARDRLWQIDLWRKRGLGLLAKTLGPAYVDQDRAARLFLYRGDMQKEWAAYAPDSRQWVTAFVDGINAYVAQVRSGVRPLPIEFKLTDSRPDTWQPEDVRSHSQPCAGVQRRIGSRARPRRMRRRTRGRRVAPQSGTAGPQSRGAGGPQSLRCARGRAQGLHVGDQAGGFQRAEQIGAARRAPAPRQLAAALEAQSTEGSNNWVIAPSRTATGRPILANDPHRQLGVPSLRYIVALNAPGLTIIGAGEPALPGISFGHNDNIAFGLTILTVDQEDLYVYELKQERPRQLSLRDPAGRKCKSCARRIEVKGGAAREVELRYTRHGPVLKLDAGEESRLCPAHGVERAGPCGLFRLLAPVMAKNWDEFKAAVNAWGAPPLNLVYADVQGNIGWAAAGRAPMRKNWDGLMPVPGDGRYEWAGFQGKDVLPSNFNPPAGFFATANEMNLPAQYPNEQNRIAFEWGDRSRIDRLNELLGAKTKETLADSMAIQTDVLSTQSRRAVALLAAVSSQNAALAQALSVLKAWNHEESTDSVAAAIYEVWATKYLGKTTVAKAAPQAARKLIGSGQLQAVIEYLEHPDGALGADPKAARDTILLESLQGAVDELTQRLGADMTTWAWGRLHRASFEPAVAVLADPEWRAQMSVGPLQAPGSGSTPRAQAYRTSDFSVVGGASVRLVMDVGAWDNSVAMNTPGQSDDPMSAHYRDLFPLWAQGSYVPLRFSRAAVDADAEELIHLSPGR